MLQYFEFWYQDFSFMLKDVVIFFLEVSFNFHGKNHKYQTPCVYAGEWKKKEKKNEHKIYDIYLKKKN